MQKLIFIIAFVSLCLVGQAQDSLAAKQDSLKTKGLSLDERNKIAKQLAPIEGKAIVYILRPTGYGFGVMMWLYCNDVFMGSTFSKNYVYTVLEPGQYTFTSEAENKHKFGLTVEGGKIYYLIQDVKMGFAFARTKLRRLSDENGRKFLNKTKLAKDNAYGK